MDVRDAIDYAGDADDIIGSPPCLSRRLSANCRRQGGLIKTNRECPERRSILRRRNKRYDRLGRPTLRSWRGLVLRID